jgi:hypothetical protein
VSADEKFHDLTRFLLDNDPVRAVHGAWDVLRVGRNPVWRIRSTDGLFYAKIMRAQPYYRREHHGLDISRQLADRYEWITAPELVYTNEAQGVLITTALPGVGVGRVFRAAFRMDRNPFRRDAPIEAALGALSQVLQWLGEFHQMPVTCREVLFDHSTTRRRDRIFGKLTRGIEHGVLEVAGPTLERFRELDVSVSTAPAQLISGDATLGNFLWDGQRIGRVDFEDLGFGAPARDYSEIRQGLEAAGNRPWYWGVDRAMTLVPTSTGRVEDALYRLEWTLDRHWPGGPARRTKRMRDLERRIQHMLTTITG